MEGCKGKFAKQMEFWAKEEMTTFLPPDGRNITSKFAATVDSFSIESNCGGQRSLAALL